MSTNNYHNRYINSLIKVYNEAIKENQFSIKDLTKAISKIEKNIELPKDDYAYSLLYPITKKSKKEQIVILASQISSAKKQIQIIKDKLEVIERSLQFKIKDKQGLRKLLQSNKNVYILIYNDGSWRGYKTLPSGRDEVVSVIFKTEGTLKTLNEINERIKTEEIFVRRNFKQHYSTLGKNM